MKLTCASSQAPAWELGTGSSSFLFREARASPSGFPSWSLGTSANYNPLALMLILNSIIGELQLERVGTGGVQTNISSNDINKIIIPVVPNQSQTQIADFIQQSFTLKAESEHLLNVAKRAVEIAIETDEQTAVKYINEQTGEKS